MANKAVSYLKSAALSALAFASLTPTVDAAQTAVFGGGPFYSGGPAVFNNLRLSGYTTVILWAIHVNASNGDLVLNDQLVASGGNYVGNSAWPSQLNSLRQQPTSVNRIEICVGSAGPNDFQSIKTLIASGGTGTGSILYRNFLALKNATGANAVCFDDEALFDTNTSVTFGRMLSNMGLKVTFAPYNNQNHWRDVKTQLGSIVDAVYLQCYDGGAGNNPATWNTLFGGLKVTPGLWGRHNNNSTGDSPASVQSRMVGWRNSAGVTGGFMWLYDDLQNPSNGSAPIQYANAIQSAFGDGKPYYKIVNQNSGKAVDLIAGDLNNGARVNQYSYAYFSDNQNWLVTPSENADHFILVSGITGKCACVQFDSLADQAQIHDYDYTGNNPSQQWDLVDVGNGWYNFRNVRSGKMLDVAGGSTADDAKLQQYTNNGAPAQKFRLQPWGDYFARSSSGRYVCVEGGGSSNGNRIVQFDKQNNAWFKWRFESVGDGNLRASSLNALSRVLCVIGGSSAAGQGTHLYDYFPANGGDQKVRIRPQLNGKVKFNFVHDNQSWDVPGGQTGNLTPITQYPDNGNAQQQFTLERSN